MKPADGEDGKTLGSIFRFRRSQRIDTEPVDDDFRGIDFRVMFNDVLTVEFRDRDAKLAFPELHIQVGRAEKQVGPVERHAEVDLQESRSSHSDPRREKPVVDVDMRDVMVRELEGKTRAQERVRQSAQSAGQPFQAAKENSYE